jgi:acyl-CoA reductase-like NAD-dependent aldehyde dehydrogenase/nicotinamidase-related amidase
MRAALLLVDLQHDFLERPGLTPSREVVVDAAAALLQQCRSLHLPIVHVQTRIRADGSDRMPHWNRRDIFACVEGSPGAEPPAALRPASNEPLYAKRFFSAFGNTDLEDALRAQQIDTLIIAGIYLHGCVRATALDAYERGFEVWVADEAVASTEPLHAEITRHYLHDRAALFLSHDDILSRLTQTASPDTTTTIIYQHFNPAQLDELIASVAYANTDEIKQACLVAQRAQQDWQHTPHAERVTVLARWRQLLQAQTSTLASRLATEIGKPLSAASEEIRRTLAHIDSTLRLAEDEARIDDGVKVRYRPVGCIALITPWNNPLAIPVAKLAAALIYGNSVVWKPALQATVMARLVLSTLHQAGLPQEGVKLVCGDARTARQLISDPHVAAVSLTGSIASGQASAALCHSLGKPLQAELGGNNALIVLEDADLDQAIDELALAAFAFAGQRCTATRRFIVAQNIVADFEERLADATHALHVGDPHSAGCQVGPLISLQRRNQIEQMVTSALKQPGIRLLTGGRRPDALEQGCWYLPTLLSAVDPSSAIVQQESFGPIAVILPAADLDEALRLANDVPHGLVSGLLTHDPLAMRGFLDRIEAGILKLGNSNLTIHPDAPFGGWKSSQIGPPEHGRWDRDFFTRPQAVYRDEQQS